MCIAIVGYLGYGIINFEMNLIFQIKPFCASPKGQNKNLNILRMRRAFKMK